MLIVAKRIKTPRASLTAQVIVSLSVSVHTHKRRFDRERGKQAIALYLREKRDIRSHTPGASTELLAFCQVGGLIVTTGGHLEKRKRNLHREENPFFKMHEKKDR